MTAHQLTQTESGSYRCAACQQSWKREPSSDCPGVKVYGWGAWGEELLTKKQMNDAGFQTGKQLPTPAGVVRRDDSPGGWMWLYARDSGVPKKVVSEAQKAALAKAAAKAREGWHCQRCGYPLGYYSARGNLCKGCQTEDMIQSDHDAESEWALQVLRQPDTVILDTETTGLTAGYNEIIQLAVIDLQGNVLIDTLIKPEHPERMFERGERGRSAHDIHGISAEALADAPTFPEVHAKLLEILRGKIVLIYNKSFDVGMLKAMREQHQLPSLAAEAWVDVMLPYSAWCGEWSSYWGNYRWQPLGGGHTALADCRAVLAVLHEMSRAADELKAADHLAPDYDLPWLPRIIGNGFIVPGEPIGIAE